MYILSEPRDVGGKLAIAVAVLESGTEKLSKIVRLLYSFPPSVTTAIETSISMPRKDVRDGALLFSGRARSDVETILTQRFCVLTRGQCCGDCSV